VLLDDFQPIGPHVGRRPDAFKPHISPVIESAGVIEVSNRLQPGQTGDAIASFQFLGAPLYRNSNSAANRSRHLIAGQRSDTENKAASIGKILRIACHHPEDMPSVVIYAGGNVMGRKPRGDTRLKTPIAEKEEDKNRRRADRFPEPDGNDAGRQRNQQAGKPERKTPGIKTGDNPADEPEQHRDQRAGIAFRRSLGGHYGFFL